MSSVYRIATSDDFHGQYKDERAFIEGVLGRLKIEARRLGWHGTQLFDADWIEMKGQPPLAVVAIESGIGEATVADIRKLLVDKKRKERAAT